MNTATHAMTSPALRQQMETPQPLTFPGTGRYALRHMASRNLITHNGEFTEDAGSLPKPKVPMFMARGEAKHWIQDLLGDAWETHIEIVPIDKEGRSLSAQISKNRRLFRAG
ncbi:MAG: hypothetical protein ABIY70_24780 [Capsulimonas sp.]|uniref:hypothetical protein n=1 Tax=Capsulimonas sp. TaxID=2494211 RepID=UPI0032662A3C